MRRRIAAAFGTAAALGAAAWIAFPRPERSAPAEEGPLPARASARVAASEPAPPRLATRPAETRETPRPILAALRPEGEAGSDADAPPSPSAEEAARSEAAKAELRAVHVRRTGEALGLSAAEEAAYEALLLRRSAEKEGDFDFDAALAELLGPERAEAHRRLMEAERERGVAARIGAEMDAFSAALGLTEAQRAALTPAHAAWMRAALAPPPEAPAAAPGAEGPADPDAAAATALLASQWRESARQAALLAAFADRAAPALAEDQRARLAAWRAEAEEERLRLLRSF